VGTLGAGGRGADHAEALVGRGQPRTTLNGSDYRRTRTAVDRTGRLTVRLAEGGGWAARISPQD